jgi:hypothetical protein
MGRLVDGEARQPRQVGPGEGEIDIAAANGMHPMPAFSDCARHRREGHLLSEYQYQYQRLEW